MKNIAVLLICFFGLMSHSYGQAPGLVIQGGVSTMYAKDSNITQHNQAHYGYVIGADARLLDGDMYFILGGQYHATSLASTSSPDFFKGNDWKILMGRMGIGFNILSFGNNIALRSKVLASINFTLDSPQGGLMKPGYTEVNDSSLGATTGLGLTLGAIDIDVEYQYGFINAYRKQPKTTFDVWTLVAGFHF